MPRQFDEGRAKAVLADCDRIGIEGASQKHGVTRRTIERWTKRLRPSQPDRRRTHAPTLPAEPSARRKQLEALLAAQRMRLRKALQLEADPDAKLSPQTQKIIHDVERYQTELSEMDAVEQFQTDDVVELASAPEVIGDWLAGLGSTIGAGLSRARELLAKEQDVEKLTRSLERLANAVIAAKALGLDVERGAVGSEGSGSTEGESQARGRVGRGKGRRK
jgi:transposase